MGRPEADAVSVLSAKWGEAGGAPRAQRKVCSLSLGGGGSEGGSQGWLPGGSDIEPES